MAIRRPKYCIRGIRSHEYPTITASIVLLTPNKLRLSMRLRVAPLSFIFCGIVSSVSAQIKPFTTDGCSVFPDGTTEQNALWIECCIRHDFAYWQGGTALDREQADSALQQCVADLGKKDISSLMHFGVRMGGSPFYPTWYRWGYGWPYLRGYKALTQDEQRQVREQLLQLRSLVDEFIEQSTSSTKKP